MSACPPWSSLVYFPSFVSFFYFQNIIVVVAQKQSTNLQKPRNPHNSALTLYKTTLKPHTHAQFASDPLPQSDIPLLTPVGFLAYPLVGDAATVLKRRHHGGPLTFSKGWCMLCHVCMEGILRFFQRMICKRRAWVVCVHEWYDVVGLLDFRGGVIYVLGCERERLRCFERKSRGELKERCGGLEDVLTMMDVI